MENTALGLMGLQGIGCTESAKPCGCGCNGGSQLGTLQITANDTPDLSEWSCNDYVTWHKRLTEAHGLESANEIAQQFWDKIPWYRLDWTQGCYANCNFYNHFRSAGGGWASLLPSTFCTLDSAGGKLVDSAGNIVGDIGEAGENLAKGAANTGKTLSWLVPALGVGAAALVGTYLYKNYIKGNKQIKVGTTKI